jgi:simple sugar transport system ATP-binding protein
VIVISHNLEDIFAVSDRIVGLRLGEITLDSPIAATTHEEVMACMTMGAFRR